MFFAKLSTCSQFTIWKLRVWLEFRQMEATFFCSLSSKSPINWICCELGDVIVPVLSKTNAFTLAICSIAAVFLIKSLFLSKILSAAESVNGELSASAHGQAIINTAVKAAQALDESLLANQKTAARVAINNSTVVKYLLIELLNVCN